MLVSENCKLNDYHSQIASEIQTKLYHNIIFIVNKCAKATHSIVELNSAVKVT